MIEILNNYSLDNENPEYNLYLALEYDKLDQTSSAISFYLRAAERSIDPVISCLALIKMGLCFKRQGNYTETLNGIYKQVIDILDSMNDNERKNTKEYLKKKYQIDVDMISNKKMYKIVDFFTYFNPTGKEILELRYNIMKDYVDEFVICESNKTQSGKPIEYGLRKTLEELNIPQDKIRIIDLKIPDDDYLVVTDVDRINCYEGNYENINSLNARVRERMQKDSLLKIIDEYDEDTIFIHSDIDEIIKPKSLSWIIPIVKNSAEYLIKIPLVHLEGRADLRVFYRDSGSPKEWTGMFICTKEHLKRATPTQLRSNAENPYPIGCLMEGNEKIEDLGWHFCWMGSSEKRVIKSQAFTHYDDTFSFLKDKKYNSDGNRKFLEDIQLKEGSISPSGEINTILKDYPHDELPEEIFNIPRVKNFLLPEIKSDRDEEPFFTFSYTKKPTVWTVDNFYEYPDKVREFALNQYYIEGGIGRGFIGRRTENQFLFPGLKERFEEIIGMKITEWESHGMNGRFQNCHSGEPLVYHCDSQKWGGMLYLTPGAPYQCGTTLYAHKKTRARSYNDYGWNAAWENIPGDPHLDGTPFEPVDVLGNVYNRLVIFDASCIHSASEYFGTVMENSRLWQMFFFDT